MGRVGGGEPGGYEALRFAAGRAWLFDVHMNAGRAQLGVPPTLRLRPWKRPQTPLRGREGSILDLFVTRGPAQLGVPPPRHFFQDIRASNFSSRFSQTPLKSSRRVSRRSVQWSALTESSLTALRR